MKAKLPESAYSASHADYAEIDFVERAILLAVGNVQTLEYQLGVILREDIDVVIDTPRTSRCSYSELEKTEKTYIGTRIEIGLRSLLGFPKGLLDLNIGGVDVDIKFTGGSNWMIPNEAFGKICLLVAADESRGRCYLGILKIRPEYLTGKGNRDGKVSISSSGFANIRWLVCDSPYALNFWQKISVEDRLAIFSQSSGSARLVELFRRVKNVAIDRSVIEAVARQKDYMKRLRANGGARDKLEQMGYVLLSGKYDYAEVRERGLASCGSDEFICCDR